MRTFLVSTAVIAIAVAGAGLWISRPKPVDAASFASLTPDAARGEAVFHAAGCASCHAAPGAEGEDKRVLAGGQRFASEFGTFIAPNISPDPAQGIGDWSREDFANAVMRGVSPGGQHYYPAFPYTAYQNATPQDIADLYAYMMGLPASDAPSAAHEIAFPYNIRRGVGLWKAVYMTRDWHMTDPASDAEERGRYLVEALGHCAECHTPRTALGGLDRDNWMAGAPNPSGRGRIPDITAAGLGWGAFDIAAYLESGFTPDFDVVGGSMAEVVENFARLPASDREAVAAYLLRAGE
ncbi:c-type cytochrome [Roseicitreum antarcticum]|uniref:Cytochrome c, mono-and diheme variants n=1 Tax=Roseicitreum antarcticum TaxID=564137 RepID=A0A1H2XXR6_9RHOB|nr:cytochrome c [Roseicitreum antarcticum]SDW97742.1 Cytochrome c, mono-and diheme variants [Roseicitreum antarcticum]